MVNNATLTESAKRHMVHGRRTVVRGEGMKVTSVGSIPHFTHPLKAAWSFCDRESLIADALCIHGDADEEMTHLQLQ